MVSSATQSAIGQVLLTSLVLVSGSVVGGQAESSMNKETWIYISVRNLGKAPNQLCKMDLAF